MTYDRSGSSIPDFGPFRCFMTFPKPRLAMWIVKVVNMKEIHTIVVYSLAKIA